MKYLFQLRVTEEYRDNLLNILYWENKMIRVGVIGLGYWGKALLEYFRTTKNCKVVAVQEINPEIEKEIDLSGIKFYKNLEEFFSKEKMDAVVVVIPPPYHIIPVKIAAEKGIHVFCEKPISASLKDADEMIRVCKKNNVILMVAFKHRFSKAFSYVKKKLDRLGNPLWAMYTYPLWRVDDPGWKFDEKGTKGIIVENMVHAIDGLRFLFGDVKKIYAEGDNFIFKDKVPPDSAIFTIRFKNGAIGAIGGGCTSDSRISQEYLDMHFENGVANIYGKLDFPFNLRLLMREEENLEYHKFEGSDGVREEIAHFIDCIVNDREPISTGEDGRKALEVALNVIKSIRENKVVDF